MLGFLKKLFGFDKETMKDAGVQIEQQAPYKVEPPAKVNDDVDAPDWLQQSSKGIEVTEIHTQAAAPTTPIPLVVEKVEIKEVTGKKPAAMTATKKPRGPKKPQGPKPATKPATPKQPAKPAAPKRGRKPKAK